MGVPGKEQVIFAFSFTKSLRPWFIDPILGHLHLKGRTVQNLTFFFTVPIGLLT